MTEQEPQSQAVLGVTRGNPTPEELAALTVLLSALGTSEPAAEPATSAWTSQTRQRRAVPRPGPDAWRLSTRS